MPRDGDSGAARIGVHEPPADDAQRTKSVGRSLVNANGSDSARKRPVLPVKGLDPTSYDVEARVRQLRKQEAGTREKEELDSLLERYLQVT